MVFAGPEIRKLSNDLKMSQVFGKIVAKKFCQIVTSKSFSEALILASTNPQYYKRLFVELPVQHMKTIRAEHGKNKFCACSAHVLHRG